MAGGATLPVTMTPSSSRGATILQQVSERGKSLYTQRRPWGELINANINGGSAFARPESFADAVARVRRHAAYFRVNYAVIVLAAVLCSLVSEPLALFAIGALVAAWCLLYFCRDEPLVVLNRTFGEGAVLACLTVATILTLFLTNVTATILTAVAVGVAVVLVHAVFRVSDDLFLDEEEAVQSGIVANGGYATITSVPSVPSRRV